MTNGLWIIWRNWAKCELDRRFVHAGKSVCKEIEDMTDDRLLDHGDTIEITDGDERGPTER